MSKAPPLEKTITNQILKYLNGLPRCRARKIPGGTYGGGWPDIICVRSGRAVFIEVKRPKVGRLTPLQEKELTLWHEAGAVCFVATSVDDVRGYFE
jgi:hypothetical protein